MRVHCFGGGIVAGAEAEEGLDELHPADRPAPDDLHQCGRLRMAAVHEQHAVGTGRLSVRHRLSVARGHWLFDQHMLTRLRRGDGVLGMQGVRRGDVNRIDVLVGQHPRVITVRPGHSVLLDEGLRTVGRSAAHGHQDGARRGPECFCEERRDRTGGNDAELNRVAHCETRLLRRESRCRPAACSAECDRSPATGPEPSTGSRRSPGTL